jgi:hypothetical protein
MATEIGIGFTLSLYVNTIGAQHMANPRFGGQSASMFL